MGEGKYDHVISCPFFKGFLSFRTQLRVFLMLFPGALTGLSSLSSFVHGLMLSKPVSMIMLQYHISSIFQQFSFISKSTWSIFDALSGRISHLVISILIHAWFDVFSL
jgi:hypothetical protein